MSRRIIKAAISQLLHDTGADRVLRNRAQCPVVFAYHRVVPNFATAATHTLPPMLISSQMFERHLEWIGQRFSIVSLDEIGSTLEQGKTFRDPVAAITFDDGYQDTYRYAFPILKRRGIPAAVFVVTGLVGTSHAPTHDKLYALLSQAFSRWRNPCRSLSEVLHDLKIITGSIRKARRIGSSPFEITRKLLVGLPLSEISRVVDALEDRVCPPPALIEGFRTLTWEMLAEMNSRGITIGSHTRSHILLTNEDHSTVQRELEQSRVELAKHLDIPIHHFSYPDGRFSGNSIRAVASAGYRYAYTTCRHRDLNYPLYTIPRTVLWENSCVDSRGSFSGAVMSCNLSGLFDLFSGCDQEHSLSAKETRYVPNRQPMGLFEWNRSGS